MFYKLVDWIDINKLNSEYISTMSESIEILKENPEKINWSFLALNKSPFVIDLYNNIKYKSYIKPNITINNTNTHDYWSELSIKNDNISVNLLLNNINKIDWYYLSFNTNDKIIDYMINNLNKIIHLINFRNLSANHNPKVLKILETNQDKIDWIMISNNPIIFTLDYKKIKNNKQKLHDELFKKYKIYQHHILLF